MIRLLAVDENPEVLATYVRVLDREPDIRLETTASCGREAVRLADRVRPDVILLDASLPGLSGIEVAERIHCGLPSIGLVLVTAERSVELAMRALRAGVREFISKPPSRQDLINAVRLAASRVCASPDPGLSRTWAFLGCKGTVGATTLAVSTSYALARSGYSVVLVDADQSYGDCGFQLDLQPSGRSLSALLRADEEIDLGLIDAHTREWQNRATATRFSLIESEGELCDLSGCPEHRMVSILDALSGSYQRIVVDLPPGRLLDPHVAAAVESCDELIMVTNADLPSLKALAAQLRTLAASSLPLGKMKVVVNHLVTQTDLAPVEWIRERFPGIGSIHEATVDRDACSRALADGIPVALGAPAGPISRLVQGLIATDEEAHRTAPRANGWMSGLWDMLRVRALSSA